MALEKAGASYMKGVAIDAHARTRRKGSVATKHLGTQGLPLTPYLPCPIGSQGHPRRSAEQTTCGCVPSKYLSRHPPILQSTGLTCTLSRKHDRFPDSAIGVEETSTFLNKWNALDFLHFHNMPLSKTCLPGEVALWKVHDQCIDIQTWPPKNMSKHGREPRLLDGSAEGHTPTLPQLCFCVGNFTVSINLHCDIWRSINIDTNQITFVEYCNISFESKQATWNMTAA